MCTKYKKWFMNKKFIFLDFDGVLHGESQYSAGLFEHIHVFCDAVRPFSDTTQIVISSAWRETHTLEKLKVFFASDIAKLIVGVTPQREDSYNRGGRQREILDYCKENNIDHKQWIALDDMERFFNDACPNLILVDGETGISENNLEDLTNFLK